MAETVSLVKGKGIPILSSPGVVFFFLLTSLDSVNSETMSQGTLHTNVFHGSYLLSLCGKVFIGVRSSWNLPTEPMLAISKMDWLLRSRCLW